MGKKQTAAKSVPKGKAKAVAKQQTMTEALRRRTLGRMPSSPKAKTGTDDGTGTSQSSKALMQVKQEQLPPPPQEDQRRMIAKLHALKKNGNSDAFNDYSSLDIQGKRAWFYNIYQKDPSLSKFNAHLKQRTVFGTEQSRESEQWLTEKQIMATNGYTDAQSPDYDKVKDALLKGLESRDHENAEMAAMGFKQYRTVTKSNENLQGKTKADILHLEHEITSKDARLIRDQFDSGQAAAPEPEPGLVMIEPWKKDAMDLEKRLQGLTNKGDKLARDAQGIMLKLKSLHEKTPGGHALAQAQSDEIEKRLEVFQKAGMEFFENYQQYNSKNEANAKEQAEKVEEPIKIMKQHISHFEKLLNLAKSLVALTSD